MGFIGFNCIDFCFCGWYGLVCMRRCLCLINECDLNDGCILKGKRFCRIKYNMCLFNKLIIIS